MSERQCGPAETIYMLRRELAAKNAEIAVLREALTRARPWVACGIEFQDSEKQAREDLEAIGAALSGSPAPNPVEAMRAKCEAIAREEEVANHSVNGTRSAHQIRTRIAALKDAPQ